MTSVIKLLEQMGQNALLQNEEAVEQLLSASEINEEAKNLIIKKDAVALARQLDVCPDIVCILFPAEDDQAEENDKEEEKTEIKSVING
jgi:hypothetical protein